MNAHFLQHVSFEELGSIGPWLKSAGYKITKTQFFESDKLPDLNMLDMLIVMGGPMSVNDIKGFPWLVQEKNFIREVIDSGKPVLGICLGAQLIASAMGAEVYQNAEKEIGWYPIQGISTGDDSSFRFPSETPVFHWHGDTFSLPQGATLLARSPGCENQAFQINRSVLGLQFHLETTPESARDIVSNCKDELIQSKYVQPETEILSAKPELYKSINRMMDEVLSFLTQGTH
ncbi:gamma-glutamyl-gamma-aminobutyrate hydrolase family protein [Desulforhopalus vacuolatus]|uniref:type 1 glutamine amidotransferase n=1 Tax=Desulforhopalus vacuolatus TaxID=40414 RepID=UPI001963F4EC|nr:gamma-glutamyl-gamma-aminobutyrate hydrolase family protein [Desulforhopalus vacuolatus]MBM9520826.1 gamma-glutamyl-gamma-aminobutyrate hydrolase family protein [Desulforhopalus vacuolatus]